MDLTDAFAHWLGAAQRRPSTAKRYRAALERLARCGLWTTDSVTKEGVVLLQRHLLSVGWEPVSVRTEFSALRSVLAQLARDGMFEKTTLCALRESAVPLPEKGRKRRVRFFTRVEFERLCLAARRVVPRLEAAFRVAAWSGVRPGELLRMRAEDVKGGHFWVETLPEWGEAGSCKTGPRPVPICHELRLVLDELPKTGWLFPSAYLGPRRGPQPKTPFLSRWTFETGFARARTAAGMGRDVVPMTLRHTRASWWLQGGASVYKVADFLGHLVATCEAHYGSLVDGYDAECERKPAA